MEKPQNGQMSIWCNRELWRWWNWLTCDERNDDDDVDINADHFKAYQRQEEGGDTYFNLQLSHANEPLQCSQQCNDKIQSMVRWRARQICGTRKYDRFFLSSGPPSPPLFHNHIQRKCTKLLCINLKTKHWLFFQHCEVVLPDWGFVQLR